MGQQVASEMRRPRQQQLQAQSQAKGCHILKSKIGVEKYLTTESESETETESKTTLPHGQLHRVSRFFPAASQSRSFSSFCGKLSAMK